MHHTYLPGRRDAQRLFGSRPPALSFGLRSLGGARPGARAGSAEPERPAFEADLILNAPAQDPQVVWAAGRYHYCESSDAGIFVRSATSLHGLAGAYRHRIWAPARKGPCSRNIWAPELHAFEGRWYVYFAADDGRNENHRMWVLESTSSEVAGPYRLVRSLETRGWAIDGTAFTGRDGGRYFVWSGWPGKTDGQQNLYLSKMASPTALTGEAVLISVPSQPWERMGMPICEGPQVLQRGGRTFIIYSASASWTGDYCLGMLVHEGGDPLARGAWKKVGQVFARNDFGWGVGHCGFVTSPDGEDWILYHAKTLHRAGWADREVRAQRFFWGADGYPKLGEPGQTRRLAVNTRKAA